MTRKSNTNSALAQATGGVLLATADTDLGVVPADNAAAEAAQAARQAGDAVTLRDATTDELIATIAPDGSTIAVQPVRSKAKPNKRKLTELYVRKVKPEPTAFIVWDTLQRGLVLRVQPSGRRSWNVVYNRRGRTRWLHLGDAAAIGLADARQLAAEAMLAVARGGDPAAERKAERGSGTFAELAERYVEQHAKKHNRSWKQAASLISRFASPRWGRLSGGHHHAQRRANAHGRDRSAGRCNQTLAAISAIFTWAANNDLITANPCRGVARNPTKSRERILSESEIPQFWTAFDDADPVIGSALKVILLPARGRARWHICGVNIFVTAGGRCRASRCRRSGGRERRTRRNRIAFGCRRQCKR